MSINWKRLYYFAKSNIILLVMTLFISLMMVWFYSFEEVKVAEVNILAPIFLYYFQIQIFQKKQSLKYKLSLPDSRESILVNMALEFFILSIPQIITMQVFYSTLSKHVFYNPNRVIFLIYSILGFFAFSMFSVRKWIHDERRETITNKWEIFVLHFTEITLAMFNIALAIGIFHVAHLILEKFQMETPLGPILFVAILLGFIFVLRQMTYKVYLSERQSYFRWSRHGVVVVLAGISIFSTIAVRIYYLQKNSFSNKMLNALKRSKLDKASVLALKTPDINVIKERGWTASLALARFGDSKTLKTFLATGLEIDEYIFVEDKDSSEHMMGLIHILSMRGQRQMLEKLESNFENIDMRHPISMSSALHYASQNCHIKTMDYLISRGAKVDARNRYGETPLMIATSEQCPLGVAVLLEQNADPYAKNVKGENAFSYEVEKDSLTGFLLRRKEDKKSRRAASVKK